ncbi:MAG: prepilin-type N-terminal cleavage/methylation domain-containing protein [Candidatus Pacebacteria bacterium]|nr:prepilin-type N-terminal cleavage/methylation domain-containing protein [Candidatus Paceibacterota bacterium]
MLHSQNRAQKKGFTLVELLIVIGIIVILLSVVLLAVDPAKRLKQSRDSVRRQDVSDILEAIITYETDNSGSIPSGIDSTSGTYQILGTGGSTGCAASSCTNVTTLSSGACLDISSSLVPTYFASVPMDPLSGSAANTLYAVDKNSAGRIIVAACVPEVASSISLQR